MNPSPPTLGIAQTVPVAGDVAANVAQHLELARRAAGAGADLLLFPELSLTGYELELANRLAFEPEDERLNPLAQCARAEAICLVVGAPLELEGALHIASIVLRADGSREIYTKHHLGAFPPETNPDGPVPPPEASVFAPGEHDPLIEVKGARIALAICADTNRPNHPAAAAGRGADVYLASMFFTPRESDEELARMRRIANEHSMLVGVANFGGPTGGLESAGRSVLYGPNGEPLEGAPSRSEHLLLVSRPDAS